LPGGIFNGITSDENNEEGIAFIRDPGGTVMITGAGRSNGFLTLNGYRN